MISILNGSKESNKSIIIKKLTLTYEISEVSRLLLEISIQVRNNIELGIVSNYSSIHSLDSDVGLLFRDFGANPQSSIVLSFREACNKIIHTKHINFELENAKSLNDYEHLNSIVYLFGDFHEREWKAELNVKRFLETLVGNL